MNKQYIRIYQYLDVNMLKSNMLIYGEISGNCANCQAIDIKLDVTHCPSCRTEYKYIAFRNIRSHMAKLSRILAARPHLIFVDHEDFHRTFAAEKARDLLR